MPSVVIVVHPLHTTALITTGTTPRLTLLLQPLPPAILATSRGSVPTARDDGYVLTEDSARLFLESVVRERLSVTNDGRERPFSRRWKSTTLECDAKPRVEFSKELVHISTALKETVNYSNVKLVSSNERTLFR